MLMAAIAIDAHSKFKRTYFPSRDDVTLLLLYSSQTCVRAVRIRENGTISRATSGEDCRKEEQREYRFSRINIFQESALFTAENLWFRII